MKVSNWAKSYALVAGLSSAVSAGAVHTAWGQDYPSREITVVVGYAAGSGADLVVRLFAEELRKRSGQTVIVDNKPGALTNIAAQRVATAKPDGYTVLITPGSSTFAINSAIFKDLPFDPLNDFTPVTSLVTTPFVFLVSEDSKIQSIADLSADLKAKAGKARYGYPNSISLVAAELYKKVAGVDAVGVSYKSMPDAHAALRGGEVDFFVGDLIIRGGRRLALTTRERSDAAPGTASALEQGLKDYDLFSWFAAYLPKGASAQVQEKLAGWFRAAVADPAARKRMLELGVAAWPGVDGEQLRAFTRSEMQKWKALTQLAQIPAP
ncbi:MAG TPA: tripartite tricarboxylate transporter substrate binding protein [Beijerinckiaceae bacterium]|jgi:tripartite-type tricarboxylate transporter receptor subunit TctC|nr:tripartite tricarboxylate transporter substrate binding protein [Beijerinckiaceae bacterium]